MIQSAPIPASPTLQLTELLKPMDGYVKVDSTPVDEEEDAQSVSQSVLQDLGPTDRLLITKRLSVKSVLFLRGKKNRFYVRTSDHKLIYTIEEENRYTYNWWVGYFCYGLRPLQLRVTDSLDHEIMRINRPFACTTRVFPCQLQMLEVFAPPGHKIGSVEQQWTAVRPVYIVKDAEGQNKFWIRGPYTTVSCFRDVQFDIQRAEDGSHVGATCKQWQGLAHAMFMAPVTDRFGVAFEISLSDEEKGLLLAATLLMEYMYYDV